MDNESAELQFKMDSRVLPAGRQQKVTAGDELCPLSAAVVSQQKQEFPRFSGALEA